MCSRDHWTIYISSSSIEDYHLRFPSNEDEEEASHLRFPSDEDEEEDEEEASHLRFPSDEDEEEASIEDYHLRMRFPWDEDEEEASIEYYHLRLRFPWDEDKEEASIEDYHLRFASDEDEEEELEVVLKPMYLQASTLTEKENIRDVDDDDCVILNSNLFHPNNIDIQSKLSLSYNDTYGLQDEDVTVISERGQVACRDYPHSRHHCGKFPFNKTSHDTCCPQCYCYVCDLVAPCKYWSGNSGHCHASDLVPKWKDMRAVQRGLQKET